MKKLFRWVAMVGLASASLAAENWTKDQQAVADLFTAWGKAQVAGDRATILAALAPDCTIAELGSAVVRNRASFEAMLSEFLQQMKVSQCEMVAGEISIMGDTAVVHGRYHEAFAKPNGEVVRSGGPWTSTVVRAGDKWLVRDVTYLENLTEPAGHAERAIRDVFKAWAEAQPGWRTDRSKVTDLWTPDFTFWDLNDPAPKDRAGAEKMMTEFHDAMKTTSFGISTESVVAKGGYAIANGRYDETFVTPDEMEMRGGGPWSATLVRTDGKWLVQAMSLLSRDSGPVDATVTERELIQLEHAWAKAYVDRDVATMDRLEAEEWICTTADGEIVTKAEDIADVKSGAFQATVFKMEDVKVRVYGDMAVATALQTEVATYKGKDASKVLRCTDTWVRRDGRWQCVNTHVSYAKK